jgi:short subunit dehydrogenase-like uncharacterized protein
VARILVVGGYGAFGARVAERLAREPALEIVVAGRSDDKARAHAETLAHTARARVTHAVLDAAAANPEALRALSADILINASGPFQHCVYALPRACVAAGCHYIDLADARAFVTGIGVLDAEAKAAGVSVISGASSVPGLSSAAVQRMAEDLAHLDEVHIGISPGNSFDPGLATAASIIGQAGKAFTVRHGGRPLTVHGWQGLHRHRFSEVGYRWMSNVDVPDLDLFPQHYPELSTVRFSAGLEVGLFHLGLWAASWPARAGIVSSLAPLAAKMLAMKRRLSALGSDTGGMFALVVGRDRNGASRTRAWHLVARSGDGPYVPAMASVILAKHIVAGSGPPPGAMPCFGLFTLGEFEAEISDLDITCWLERD